VVLEYKLFKISNKTNLFIALVQYPVSQMKMPFQEIRIIATGPCITNQLRDVNTIYAGEAGILLHIFGKFMILKLKSPVYHKDRQDVLS
jgi:hypothetical protein